LILKIKDSLGLRVDTAPLEAVLLNISQTLKSHDLFVSQLPKVESAQCDLRKDLNRLRLAVESMKTVNEDDDVTDASSAFNICDSVEKVLEERNTSITIADDHRRTSSYGIRKSEIEPIHLRHASGMTSANAKSLREIKSSIRRLQQDRDDGVVNSMELDESIKSLKESLQEVQHKLTSSASVEQMQVFHQSLVTKHGLLEHHLQEFKTSFHEEVGGSIDSLRKENSWFKDLDASVKQRQAKLEQRVASCAKEYDIATFRESVESDVETLQRKASFLDDTAKAQGNALVMLQQKNAIAMFRRHYKNWKQNALKTGLSRWRKVVKHQNQYEEGKTSQKRLVRKILTNIMSRRKRFGFERWIRYRNWHRNMERQKLKASTLICERFALYLSVPKTMAFNRWRRVTLMDKMKCIRRDIDGVEGGKGEPQRRRTTLMNTHEIDDVEFEDSESQWQRPTLMGTDEADSMEEKENGSSPPAPHLVRQRQSTLRMDSILDLFKNDVQGATYALAQEIESIKSHDIASLRQDWYAENKRMMSSIRTAMDEAIHRVEDNASTFQETVNERVDTCTDDLPMVQSKLDGISDQFESNRAELKRVEESHKQRIDALFHRGQQFDQRLGDVEGKVNTAACNIKSLFDEQIKSNKSIEYLRDIIAKNEERHEEERSIFQEALNHFGDELLKTKVTLGHTRVRCESLEKDLVESKSELVHFQNACQSENARLQRRIHHPGLPKPSLNRIVNVGHAYETLAKEKNYVTGINVITTLKITTTTTLKKCSEKMRNEEDVDVPAEIVAFAHDYAAWVSYQADHETLLRFIVGTNPEEQVYAEDDTNTRKKELCSELKSELGTLLEQASSHPTFVDDTECSTTTRGSGLRWEARAIFLARVSDATNAALSKHDQILLPASTRLGRVRPLTANITVCVACDRPMRRKGNRSQSAKTLADGEEKTLDGNAKGQKQKQNDRLELRPQTTMTSTAKTGDLLGGDGAHQIPRSSSCTGQVIKATRLAESLKENTEPTPFFDINNTFS